MSDKNKDALDLDKLEALVRLADDDFADSARFSMKVVRQLIALARRASQVSAAAPADLVGQFLRCSYPVAPEINPRGYNWCEAWLDEARKVALDCASEGQAQTSAAAGHTDAAMDRQYLAGYDAGFMAGERGDDDKRASVHAARTRSIRDAAQLADSTAPGAGKFDTATAIMLDVCELDYSGEAESNDTMRVNAADLRLILDRHIAAPTAQQSLTAGGAVPEGFALVPLEPTGVMKDVGASSLPVSAASTWVAADVYRTMIAAAPPLPPQVQPSEALDANEVVVDRRDLFDNLRMAWRDGLMTEFPGESESWLKATDYATEIITGWSSLRAADQQSVTPSGALGVAESGEVKL